MLGNYPLLVGALLLLGLLGGKLAKKVKLPSVTGYILLGLFIGPSFLNIVTKEMIKSMAFINHLALGILALSIGSQLHRYVFFKFGKDLFLLAIGDGLFTFTLVSGLTYLVGMPFEYAILLGVMALTVSPSGVITIIKEYGAKGNFSKNVMALVAIENLNCIILFGIVAAVLQGLKSTDSSGFMLFLALLKELGLALLVGSIAGMANSYLIKKKPNNSKFLVFLLGVILINTGIAVEFGLSSILINMTTGATIANLINRKFVLSSTLERVELPVFVIFLTLAGAKLDIALFGSVGIIGIAYIAGRLIGKIGGSLIAGRITTLSDSYRRNVGFALTPQAGVVIGLSIIAEEKMPQSNGLITGIVLTGVIFFEIVGPLLLKRALKNTGEIA
ncbi:cation:proton antiporter [Alkaliphilus serpentinus]|uniref:Cation/H+ exchanger transmembrane domain-containing protein n=1 Tax=Alkaliphilus serpentinus TaxID=1482731 RepID=A0A833HP06_9FIRM|nr:cation:proton antiporter [Alkaliphilus serpentinus]KAB3530070.1 hypothetical protein F8153_08250 [Alkaliphilus serpentinus]